MGKNLNPADQFRKEQRKKELKKLKLERDRNKELQDLVTGGNVEGMKAEIDKMEVLLESGKLNNSQSRQLAELKGQYRHIQTAQTKKETPSHNEKPQHDKVETSRSTSAPTTATATAPKTNSEPPQPSPTTSAPPLLPPRPLALGQVVSYPPPPPPRPVLAMSYPPPPPARPALYPPPPPPRPVLVSGHPPVPPPPPSALYPPPPPPRPVSVSGHPPVPPPPPSALHPPPPPPRPTLFSESPLKDAPPETLHSSSVKPLSEETSYSSDVVAFKPSSIRVQRKPVNTQLKRPRALSTPQNQQTNTSHATIKKVKVQDECDQFLEEISLL